MSRYKRYPTYKDSGVEWLGEVPKSWIVAPVKAYYDARLGKMLQPHAISETDMLLPYYRAQTVQWESIDNRSVTEMWASDDEAKTFAVTVGDLLVCEGGDACRGAIVTKLPKAVTIFQNSLHRVRPKAAYDVRWVLRLMQHLRWSGWIDVLCNKNTIVHFTSEKLGTLPCPFPLPAEQAAIATALDREIACIDALIAKKTRLIQLLKEKRQAFITHAVTNGLNPNVKMKDSGVEWIGEAPVHWTTTQLGKVTISRCDGPFGSGLKSEHYTESGVRVVRLQNIGWAEFKGNDATFIAPDYWHIELRSAHDVIPGDVLIAGLGDENNPLGRACVAPNGLGDAMVKADCYRFRTGPRAHPAYVALALSATSRAECGFLATGATRARLTLTLASARVIPLPPTDEQRAIVDEINLETGRMDALLAKVDRSIALLKERRSAFITAAVTGQIDLREVYA